MLVRFGTDKNVEESVFSSFFGLSKISAWLSVTAVKVCALQTLATEESDTSDVLCLVVSDSSSLHTSSHLLVSVRNRLFLIALMFKINK